MTHEKSMKTTLEETPTKAKSRNDGDDASKHVGDHNGEDWEGIEDREDESAKEDQISQRQMIPIRSKSGVEEMGVDSRGNHFVLFWFGLVCVAT